MTSQRGLIAARAYELWKLRGTPEGSPDVDWYQAETEILGGLVDPSKPQATPESLQQKAADVSTSDSDRGPTDSATQKVSPNGPSSQRAQTRTKR